MSIETGGPAFPSKIIRSIKSNESLSGYKFFESDWQGMTLRDYLAIHASDSDVLKMQERELMTREAARYVFADKMITQRKIGL